MVLLGYMLVERPKGFIPNEDQGYLIVSVQTPDGTTREPTSRIAQRVGAIAQQIHGVSDVLILDGLNLITSTNQTNSATAFVILEEWSKRKAPDLRAAALTQQLQAALAEGDPGRPGPGLPAAADPRAEPDRRLRVPGRGPRRAGGSRPWPRSPTSSSRRPASGPSWSGSSRRSRPASPSSASTSTASRPAGSRSPSPTSSTSSSPTSAPPMSTTSTSTARPGRSWSRPRGTGGRTPDDVLKLYVLNREGKKVPLGALGRRQVRRRPDRRAPLQYVQLGQDHRPAGAGVQLGPGDPGDGGGGRRRSCPRGSATSGRGRPTRS